MLIIPALIIINIVVRDELEKEVFIEKKINSYLFA